MLLFAIFLNLTIIVQCSVLSVEKIINSSVDARCGTMAVLTINMMLFKQTNNPTINRIGFTRRPLSKQYNEENKFLTICQSLDVFGSTYHLIKKHTTRRGIFFLDNVIYLQVLCIRYNKT